MIVTPFGNRSEAPRAPAEIAEAVELYAREHGRTGSIEFAVGPNLWLVKLSLRPNDPAMKAWQEGRAVEPPTEVVWLQERNPNDGKVIGWNGDKPVRGTPYRALDIQQMGAAGVRAFLDRGNTWTGRGEHASLTGALKASYAADEVTRAKNRATVREDTRDMIRDKRRSYLKIPFLRVGINLKKEKKE